jgi:hypothetical protein
MNEQSDNEWQGKQPFNLSFFVQTQSSRSLNGLKLCILFNKQLCGENGSKCRMASLLRRKANRLIRTKIKMPERNSARHAENGEKLSLLEAIAALDRV